MTKQERAVWDISKRVLKRTDKVLSTPFDREGAAEQRHAIVNLLELMDIAGAKRLRGRSVA